QDVSSASEESVDDDMSSFLPVLYIEDGKAILRFSEIFGINEPFKKAGKRDFRYITPREIYKYADISDIAEEDEELYLRAPCRDLSWMRKFQRKINVLDLGIEDVESGNNRGLEKKSIEINDSKKDNYIASEPMKHDSSVEASSEWDSPLSPQFCPLDQEDWEERIVWNGPPSPNDVFAESCELSGPDDTNADKVGALKSSSNTFESEVRFKSHDNKQLPFLNDSYLVEPFGFEKPSEASNPSISDCVSHPQLLRLETINDEIVKDVPVVSELSSNAIRRFSELTLQNRNFFDGSWLECIIWEQNQSVSRPKLILDLQDDQMLFELSDMKDAAHLQFHSRAMIVPRPIHSLGGDSAEHHNHGLILAGRFNISNDKFYSNRKSSQQQRSHSKKRTIQGIKVLHSVPALKLQTMKAKLSNKDIANFHRPKAFWYPHDIEVPFKDQGRLAMQCTMKIILKSLGGKGSKLHVDTEETLSSIKAKASKKLDFKLSEPVQIFFSGRELDDNKSLAEQNVQPNSVLHLIRTKVHLLPRAQKLPGENKSLRPPGAFKKKSDLSVKDGHIYLMEYCEERPLLLGNAGMGARLCTYYQKSMLADQMGSVLRNGNNGLGSVVILDPSDKSPFLGDIRPASYQSCLETNMYRAPIFRHKVPSTDYLLVRSSKGKLSIRRIDRIDVVGQQEPHIEVMSPGSKVVQLYIMNRLLVYMFREFLASEKRGVLPSVSADELALQFPSLSEPFLRKRLKNCADLQKRPNGSFLWVMKQNFRIPSEEELRRMVTPEHVCAYESMLAGLYRLKRLGITGLMHPTGISSAMNQLPGEAITLATASHIERELQITPWNLTSNFVACTNQARIFSADLRDRGNIERLEITGVGDPSGRGLGFSYVRSTPKAPISNASLKKKAIVGKGSTVTGTDADLRRLSMEAAKELLLKFGVSEEQIGKLTRWHRIALIRKLSSEQAASGVKVDPTMVSKFARGQRMSFLQLQQQTREKCQEIWDRQVQSLCSGDGEENESESDANSDLDSFAGDLENLLDAEEGEEVEEGSYITKYENIGGVKGLKMRRRSFQTQAEEEIEDEAAEAAELCRMLMDDDEADWKKKKTKPAGSQVGLALKSKFAHENADGIKKNNVTSKRFMQPAGSLVFTEKNNKDQKEGESSSLQKHFLGKLKPKKKSEIDQMGLLNKKIKILGDGLNVLKEKKSARESFVCGACGQLGHMRTNKNCPKYGEEPEARPENADSIDRDHHQIEPKPPKKLTINGSRIQGFETQDDDRLTTPKAKTLKVKCGPADRQTPATSQTSDTLAVSDTETGSRPAVKKIVIRQQPRETVVNLDDSNNSQDGGFGFDYKKTKTITELSGGSFDAPPSSRLLQDQEVKQQWWLEERNSNMRAAGKMRILGEQPTYELMRFEEAIRREREEEELQKVRAKQQKKKRKVEMKDDFYSDEFPTSRVDKRRDRAARGNEFVEYGNPSQTSKRRRGGEV
ncbi:hypothetical protein M569_04282, partial [Genlisea aurea]